MKILILGSKGFVGSNVYKYLNKLEFKIFNDPGRTKLNLLNLKNFNKLIDYSKPNIVINCLGVVGGIQWGLVNKVRIYEENNQLSLNLLKSIKGKNITLINLLANCIYPYKFSKFFEKDILSGSVHSSVFEYGMTRRMLYSGTQAYSDENLIKFINLIPANVYGPGDHFDPHKSHALGALIYKFYEAKKNKNKEVEIWGTGKPKRDWLYIEDLCKVIHKVILKKDKLYSKTLNVSSNNVISIKNLAEVISNKFNFKGNINFNNSYADGDPIKSFSNKLLIKHLEFKKFTDIDTGINRTVKFYLKK